MEIKVSDEIYNFHLALDEWTPVAGHEIKVGDFKFSATPVDGNIIILEVTSGVIIKKMPLDMMVLLLTSTKENTIIYLRDVVGETLRNGLENDEKASQKIEDMRMKSIERLGDMPPIYEVDFNQMLEPNSIHLH